MRAWSAASGVFGSIALAPGGLAARDQYTQLTGARCNELRGEYPLGEVGRPWEEGLLDAAQALCDASTECLGVMHYVGQHEEHCRHWCGRPQFCVLKDGVPGDGGLSPNGAWVSYIKAEHWAAVGLPPPKDSRSSLGLGPRIGLGPSGDAVLPLQNGELFRRAQCDALGGNTWRGLDLDVVLVADALPQHGRALFPDACRVVYQPFGAPGPVDQEAAGALSETPEKGLPIFSAARLADRERGASAWRFFFDAVPEFPIPSLGIPSGKRHLLSAYFLSADSVCAGPKNSSLTAEDVSAILSPEHVFIEDGTHATREAAFRPYGFTVFCGDFTTQPFPPHGLVYSVAYVSYALVPEYIHWRSSRLFFHLPDAAQGYKSIDVQNLAVYLEDMITNPAKASVAEFKQTFALLNQQLFWYRYREPARKRADAAACALCDARAREGQRRAAASEADRAAAAGGAPSLAPAGGALAEATAGGAGGADASGGAGSGAGPDATVAFAFCAMSRRGAHKLRQVVRETWGQAVTSAGSAATHRFFVGRAEGVPLQDVGHGDVVELPVTESYRTLNLKAFAMVSWTHRAFPNMQWMIRHDDDVYLRANALMAQLAARPPVRYYWGMIDHGSAPVRDTSHQHYNSFEQFPEQHHPAWGDIFPPYARGLLWAMSADLAAAIAGEFSRDIDAQPGAVLDEASADQIPHPDDPAIGVVVTEFVRRGMSINLDDRDFNSFSLNPSCNSTFSNIHNRTWIVHHVEPETMRCMWALDRAEEARGVASSNSAVDASHRVFPDLCLCSTEVEEEEHQDPDGEPFWYDRQRFNNAR